MRVLPHDELQRRRSLVQVVVLQKEDVLDVSLGDLEPGDFGNEAFLYAATEVWPIVAQAIPARTN